jgi:hypothetical protein
LPPGGGFVAEAGGLNKKGGREGRRESSHKKKLSNKQRERGILANVIQNLWERFLAGADSFVDNSFVKAPERW